MRHTTLLFTVLLAVACSDAKPPEVKLSDALPNIPAPPNASIVSREAGEDAVKVRFRTPFNVEKTAEYYREILSKPPYTLVSDTKTPDNGYAMYAEQPGQPSLWVQIAAEGNGATVDVAGAREKPKGQ